MVHEKMKLKILEKISKDLYVHIEQVFDNLVLQQKTEYDLKDVIDHYLLSQNKERGLIFLNKKTSEVVETKRDIVFIYYCLTCPFYRELGVEAYLTKVDRQKLLEGLKISRKNIQEYLTSAKHHYRFYSDYRNIIDSNINAHLKHNQ